MTLEWATCCAVLIESIVALGGLYGLYEEYMEEDTKIAEEQLRVQKEQQARERAAEARMRNVNQRSDFVLMSFLQQVRRSVENQPLDTEKTNELLQSMLDRMNKANQDANRNAADANNANMNGR